MNEDGLGCDTCYCLLNPYNHNNRLCTCAGANMKIDWKGLYLFLWMLFMPLVVVAYGVLVPGSELSIFEYVLMFGCVVTSFYGLLVVI